MKIFSATVVRSGYVRFWPKGANFEKKKILNVMEVQVVIQQAFSIEFLLNEQNKFFFINRCVCVCAQHARP